MTLRVMVTGLVVGTLQNDWWLYSEVLLVEVRLRFLSDDVVILDVIA